MTDPVPLQPHRLMARLAAYAIADLFGLFCLFVGVSGLLGTTSTIVDGFPRSTAEAYASAAGGLAVMWWAVSRILREIRQLRNLSAGPGR